MDRKPSGDIGFRVVPVRDDTTGKPTGAFRLEASDPEAQRVFQDILRQGTERRRARSRQKEIGRKVMSVSEKITRFLVEDPFRGGLIFFVITVGSTVALFWITRFLILAPS